MSGIPDEMSYGPSDPENPQRSNPMDIDGPEVSEEAMSMPSALDPAATTTTWPSWTGMEPPSAIPASLSPSTGAGAGAGPGLMGQPTLQQQRPSQTLEYSNNPFFTSGHNYSRPDIPLTQPGPRSGTNTGTPPNQDLATIPPPPPVTTNTPLPSHPGPAPKVAIPRAAGSDSVSHRRRRSVRACEPCRQRKIKCEGNRPVCRQCVESHITCQYLDVKRVREQKQLGVLGRKVDRYEDLLKELEPEVDTGSAKKIRRALKLNDQEAEESGSSSEQSSSVGSLDAIDLVEEDLNRSEQTRATGFFGKNSEVAWMQKLENEAQHRSRRTLKDIEPPQTSQNSSSGKEPYSVPITMVSYHLDDLEIPQLENVDQYAVPPRRLADRFFDAYMESFHPSFNAVRPKTFTTQYRRFIRQPDIVRPPKKWLAVLNMVFAVGCHYCHLTGEDIGEEDGLVFMARARKLSLAGDVLFEHSDLQQVQVEFLVAFYLLARGQVNRASKFSNMAFRSALSLGINLRFVDDRTDDAAKEARSRLWWSIYTLEHSIAGLTGRVSCVSESLSSVPLPVPFDEEDFGNPQVTRLIRDRSLCRKYLKPTLFQTNEESRVHGEWLDDCEPNSSLFFYCVVDLVFIAQAVINKVYSIEGIRERSSRIERRIRKYAIKMDNWLAKVPSAYRFTKSAGKEATNGDIRFFASDSERNEDTTGDDGSHGSDKFARQKFRLAMHFYSSKITLCRPCLTHSNARSNSPFPNAINPDNGDSNGGRTSVSNSRSESNPSDPSKSNGRSESRPSDPSESASRSDTTPCGNGGGPGKEHRTRFRSEMSLSCLRASCALISLLPDEPDNIRLNRLSPWWEHLHYLMQATTALLLGLSSWPTSPPAEEKYASSATASTPLMPFPSPPTAAPATDPITTTEQNIEIKTESAKASLNTFKTESTTPAPPTPMPTLEATTAVQSTKKALRWLFHMAAVGEDDAARRAFVLCDGFMRRIAPSVGVDIDDLPEVSALPAHAGSRLGMGPTTPPTPNAALNVMGLQELGVVGDEILAGTGAGVTEAPGTGPGEGGAGGGEEATENEAEMERNEIWFERTMNMETETEMGGYSEGLSSSEDSDQEGEVYWGGQAKA